MSKKAASIVTIDIAAEIKGLITPHDLISASGNFIFKENASQIVGKEGYLFKVTTPNYCLEVGFCKHVVRFYKNKPVYNQLFYIARNDQRLEELIFGPFQPLAAGLIYCFAIWQPTQLSLLFLDKFDQEEIYVSPDASAEIEKRSRILKTSPTIPPYSLIDWARKEDIVPVMTYDSLSAFYEAVVFSLQSIQDTVKTISMYDIFWDIMHKGSKIISRQPKRETDVCIAIHGLLSKIATAKNFHISPEHQVAGGRLDFLISGPLKTGEIGKVCVEFKHAHSSDLVNGLLKQLPAYMQAMGSDFGVYCVLYFKGPHFSEPYEYNVGNLALFLNEKATSAGVSKARILVFDFSHSKPPSRL